MHVEGYHAVIVDCRLNTSELSYVFGELAIDWHEDGEVSSAIEQQQQHQGPAHSSGLACHPVRVASSALSSSAISAGTARQSRSSGVSVAVRRRRLGRASYGWAPADP